MAKKFLGRILFILHLLLWLAFLGVIGIAFTSLTSYMSKPLAVREEIRDADLIVVLGGGIDEGRYLTLVSSHRFLRGMELYFEGKAPKILFAGGGGEGRLSEATAMAQIARRLKAPEADILQEKKSKNTRDQAVEVKKIADPLRARSVLLVSSFSHMKRSVMAFENVGFKVYPAPADPYETYTRDPLGRLIVFRALIHEYVGMVYYKIRGWI